MNVQYWPDFEFRLREIAEEFDGLVSCDYWGGEQALAFRLHTQKAMKFIFCPHGQSDKGYQSNTLDRYAVQEIVLLYGSLMKEMLIDLSLWESIPKSIVVGNFRRLYYQKNRERLLKVAKDEIFSKLNPANRTLLYAPTWNDEMQSGTFFEFGEQLFKELPSHWNLIIKLHPDIEQREPVLFHRLSLIEERRENFLVVTDFPLVYPILEMVDVYLGDYSSIGYDFLSFQKPMFFLQKPHLLQAKLHTCGHVLDRSNPIFPSIEEKISQDASLQKTRKRLYEQAFTPVHDFEGVYQGILQ